MLSLLKVIAWLPLGLVHFLGMLAGWITYLLSPAYRARIHANLSCARLDTRRIRYGAVAEAGRQMLEAAWFWLRPSADVAARVHDAQPGELDALLAGPRPLLLLTPHFGGFEAFAQYYTTRPGAAGRPMTILYRVPRKAALRKVIEARGRTGLLLAPADLRGVRMLARALKQGHTAGILPDQVPSQGEGVWVPYFDRPAYTMTLPARLAYAAGARVVLVFCERMAGGMFLAHYAPLTEPLTGGPDRDTAAINRALESLIRKRPEQYLWGYARYKAPSGTSPEQAGSAR
ncbi:MAG: lysophospholipid acyltransferase family protein [Gemmatimonadota bacterium]